MYVVDTSDMILNYTLNNFKSPKILRAFSAQIKLIALVILYLQFYWYIVMFLYSWFQFIAALIVLIGKIIMTHDKKQKTIFSLVCEQIKHFITSNTFYLGISTILLSYILPACFDLKNLSSVGAFLGTIIRNLKNGNLFLTTTTILSTIIYDTWRKVQIRLKMNDADLDSSNPEKIEKIKTKFYRIGSQLNFYMLMSLIIVVIFFAIVQPTKTEQIGSIIIWIEIIFFILALWFHYRVNFINDNLDDYLNDYLQDIKNTVMEGKKDMNSIGSTISSSTKSNNKGDYEI